MDTKNETKKPKRLPKGIIGGCIQHRKIIWIIIAAVMAFGVYI